MIVTKITTSDSFLDGYTLAMKRSFGFILGMIVPIAILFYIAIYLSCCRSSPNQDANMFGAENLWKLLKKNTTANCFSQYVRLVGTSQSSLRLPFPLPYWRDSSRCLKLCLSSFIENNLLSRMLHSSACEYVRITSKIYTFWPIRRKLPTFKRN